MKLTSKLVPMNPRTAHLKPPANTQSYREESEVDRASAFPFRKHTRRRFLGRVGGFSAAVMAAGTGGLLALLDTRAAEAAEIGPESPQQRRNRAYQIRHDAALYHKNLPLPDHPTNGDEELYPNRIASYSKALPRRGPRASVERPGSPCTSLKANPARPCRNDELLHHKDTKKYQDSKLGGLPSWSRVRYSVDVRVFDKVSINDVPGKAYASDGRAGADSHAE